MKTIQLTDAEWEALKALADEGAEGILTSETHIRGYLGGMPGARAAERALEKLKNANNATTPLRFGRQEIEALLQAAGEGGEGGECFETEESEGADQDKVEAYQGGMEKLRIMLGRVSPARENGTHVVDISTSQ